MKASQALNYLAQKEGGVISRLKAIKLVFIADRYHLRKHGRLITNDKYYAMVKGPVASQTLNIAQGNTRVTEKEREYKSPYILSKGQNDLQSLCSPDLDVFSKSDIEALNYAWDKFGWLSKWDASDITHEYPEWLKHKPKLDAQPLGRFSMNLSDFLDDPIKQVDRCYELTDAEKEIRREQIEEEDHLEALWA